jgi:hypothetical protein
MGLSKFKFWQRSDPSEGFTRARPLVMMALPVLLAAFLGAGFGGLAGTFMIAGAPALALTVPGAPHRPALYALLLSREAEEVHEQVIAGTPHRLSAFAQLFWSYRLEEQPSERVITGPAHKPAELAGL